jgi:hypothetical protein
MHTEMAPIASLVRPKRVQGKGDPNRRRYVTPTCVHARFNGQMPSLAMPGALCKGKWT